MGKGRDNNHDRAATTQVHGHGSFYSVMTMGLGRGGSLLLVIRMTLRTSLHLPQFHHIHLSHAASLVSGACIVVLTTHFLNIGRCPSVAGVLVSV